MKKTKKVVKKARLDGKKLQKLTRAEMARVIGGQSSTTSWWGNGGFGNGGINGHC